MTFIGSLVFVTLIRWSTRQYAENGVWSRCHCTGRTLRDALQAGAD
jgi:hypothetical protein